MTEAQKILKMIEEVDPADVAKLDEIDNIVEIYIKNLPDSIIPYHVYNEWEDSKWTRDRNALKAIRPENINGGVFNAIRITNGWDMGGASVEQVKNLHPNFQCDLAYLFYREINGKNIISVRNFISFYRAKTEELAELHATIQAIEHERQHDVE